MYYIRADANEKIGTGHVMRCLSIAAEFHRRGRQVTFIIADDHSRTMIEERGFSAICLDSDWDCLEKEIPSLISIIKTNTIPALLIDSYFVTEFYLQALGKYTKTIYIDDLNRFIYPVDLLVNYNIYAADLDYPSRYKKSVLNTRFLLGCKYIPLREEFQNVKRTISKNVCKILITSGGTDNYNVIGNLLEAFSKQTWFANVDIYVIIGRFNPNKNKLIQHWSAIKNIHFLCGIHNMSAYMKECDLAITAGGVTTYELCACGLPSIMYTLADNQIPIAKKVSDMGLIPYAGDVRNNMKQCVRSVIEYITDFYNDVSLRIKHSAYMQNVVDGKGCERLVDEIERTEIFYNGN
jgi:UDP-2,4-diacetamido-2,4,6-trideoxy-beta-L-altropyranose hydrolase